MSVNFGAEVPCLHPQARLELGALVLYRGEPAQISSLGDAKRQFKLQIQTSTGKNLSVRPKDVLLLCGRSDLSLPQVAQRLEPPALEEAWQLLLELDSSCSLVDLAQAAFNGSGPRELYSAFCLVNETPYFKGQPQRIMVRSAAEVAAEQQRERRKQHEAARWQSFYQHYLAGSYGAEDQPFLQEIEDIAFGGKRSSRLFSALKLEQTPENAHEWLLRQGLWQPRFNPYLRRLQIAGEEPKLERFYDGRELLLWRQFLGEYRALALRVPALEKGSVPPTLLRELADVLARFAASQPLSYPRLGAAESGTGELQSANAVNVGQWRCEQRRDLTHLAAWAIDDPWSSDPDDAISLEYTEGATGEAGSSGVAGVKEATAWIHIADPASLLPFGSVVAAEARQRGATVYIPEGSIPMLPAELVQILGLGLLPVSMALSVRVRVLAPVAGNGLQLLPTVEILDLCRSWVRVQRLSYEQADSLLCEENEPHTGEPHAPHALCELEKLCKAHEQLRQRNHAVQFNMYNTKVVVGEAIVVTPLPNTPARNLVEETMLMAGAALALFAQRRQLAIAFLCQAPPKEKLPPLDSLANMFVARKAMSPSVVRGVAGPHSCIGVPLYTRGTSPLRRYLDLLTHQQLHAFFLAAEGRAVRPLNNDELLYFTAQAELQISRVKNAQRYALQHWQMLFLYEGGKKQLYKAVVLDIRSARQNTGCKALCSLPELGIETLVFSKQPLQLNQELELKLKSVQLSLREAHFQVVEKSSQ